jgi:endoglucanase
VAAPLETSSIALNSVGYLPNRIKRATILTPADSFSVVRPDGTEALPATSLTGPFQDEAQRQVWVADFSALKEPGTYRLRVAGLEDSPEFAIGNDAYTGLLDTLMAGMYGQRCGADVTVELPPAKWNHAPCHLSPAVMDADFFGAAGSLDVHGGWHDAGDFGKYVVNGAFATAQMLLAWEHFPNQVKERALAIPERGGSLPDYLDEIRFELDWMLRMQMPDDGGVLLEVQTTSWPGMIAPEWDTEAQHLTTRDSVSTAYFAAAMAQAARIYQPYDAALAETYRAAAELALGYLAANPDTTSAHPVAAKWQGHLVNNAYGNASETDARLWAAAEWWETTGSPAALADFEARAPGRKVDLNWDWGRSANLGFYTYLLSQRPGADQRNASLVGALRDKVLADADNLVQTAANDPYGNALPGVYYWGINGVTARLSLNLGVAYLLERNPKYLDGVVTQVDHLLGRNYFARSQVTGVGFSPPRSPHHRPSEGDTVIPPWPGLLVGGANPKPQTDCPFVDGPAVTQWYDSSASFCSNEVAINWNGAIIYAVIAAGEAADPFTGTYDSGGGADAGGSGGGAGGAMATAGSAGAGGG